MKEAFQKKTKIVATVGPASNNKETLVELIKAGANVFRLNFSHGTHDDHRKVIDLVRSINEELGTNVALLQDLQGPKIRISKVENDGVEIVSGQKLCITTVDVLGNKDIVSTSYGAITRDVKKGDTILIDDGNIELLTEEVIDDRVYTKVVHGGVLKSRKGINLPHSKVSAPSMTEKDEKDLQFGMTFDLEWTALSFVRTADDIVQLKDKLEKAGKHTKVVAKIEKPEALENMDSIIAATDAVMVARGDLGVEIASEEVPLAQKQLVEKCNKAGKPVIIATQMMESMIENPRPTRAETNDVANAVLDGADALMLSAESASGRFPVQAVLRMSQTIKAVETASQSVYFKYNEHPESSTRLNDLLVRAACRLGESVQAKAIVGMTKSGYTGNRLAMHRPKSDIFLFTNQKFLLRQMNLVWGVTGFYYDQTEGIDETLTQIEKRLVKEGYLEKGDVFINTASMPSHWKGHTNMMKVSTVE
ncbi:MAG: pyruvate kinase [Cyclobacteriaceae bacterium]|nr:pyruvate kinase [Cyclobacteriaceae bacterium HetDA_MAG_MS6]